jgi:hypothetical protein
MGPTLLIQNLFMKINKMDLMLIIQEIQTMLGGEFILHKMLDIL